MSELHNAARATADSNKMDEGTVEQEQKQIQTTDDAVASSSAVAAPTAAAADDARSQRLARRAQLRDEAERDAPERERRRLEALTAKAAAREARRATALTAQSALWRSFSPAQRLFADGVACCLSFLSLPDFNSAAQSCKDWREGAKRVKSLGESAVTMAGDDLPVLCLSPFRFLVNSFSQTAYDPSDYCDCSRCQRRRFSDGPARLEGVGLCALPNLTSLAVRLDLALLGAVPIQYPARMTTARLELGCWEEADISTFDASSVLSGFASCASLTRLELDLDEQPLVLTALGSLSQLRHLAIDGFVELHYTAATLHVIKSLSLLESLALKHTEDQAFDENADQFEPEWLTPLLTTPHQLQKLQLLDHGDFWLWDNDFVQQLLPSLPALTQLRCSYCSLIALPVLGVFPLLHELQLVFDSSLDIDLHEDNEEVAAAYDDHGCARLSVLVPHLTHCSLTELSLNSITCDNASLSALCQSHPRLEILSLTRAALATVQPLVTLPMLRQLRWLCIPTSCQNCSITSASARRCERSTSRRLRPPCPTCSNSKCSLHRPCCRDSARSSTQAAKPLCSSILLGLSTCVPLLFHPNVRYLVPISHSCLFFACIRGSSSCLIDWRQLSHPPPSPVLTPESSLQLHGVAFATNDLATLCHFLPRLEDLTLRRVSLSSCAVWRLFDLFLNDGCSFVESDIIEQIGACKQLQHLRMSGIPPLSPSAYEQLNPPSALLPRLQEFAFSSPAIHL